MSRNDTAAATLAGPAADLEDNASKLRSSDSVHRSGSVPHGMGELFACSRCRRVASELHRVALSNVLFYLEADVCASCIRSLRALASDLELVEVL